ncbi:MAG: SGNH/GDSL hydrolase family protein [Chloroflexota bacterium]
MKTILCYGDSNTWGFDPATGERFGRHERWPGVLREALGASYQVIEEGLCGRTTVWDDPIEGDRNGKTYLRPCLESHQPLDLVIILLGTNDLKLRFSVSAYDIACSAGALVDIVHKSETGPGGGAPRVLLLAPPPLATLSAYAEMFEGAAAKSTRLAGRYRAVAQEYGCEFLDTGSIILSSDLDGIHFEAAEHRKLGLAVAEVVRQLLP